MMIRLSAASRALIGFNCRFLGLRCAPPQALCRQPLRGLLISSNKEPKHKTNQPCAKDYPDRVWTKSYQYHAGYQRNQQAHPTVNTGATDTDTGGNQ
jgi:hypothetical protein